MDSWQRSVDADNVLKIANTLDPDVRGMGDDIDVRSYVKIKRLPGGTEADSTYVSGVVFTKNLALKRMPRTISNPRIMLVTFPVEYHHSEMQLMSFGSNDCSGERVYSQSRHEDCQPQTIGIGYWQLCFRYGA